MLNEHFVKLHHENAASMVEKRVDAFNNRLLGQIQVHESYSFAFLHSLE